MPMSNSVEDSSMRSCNLPHRAAVPQVTAQLETKKDVQVGAESCTADMVQTGCMGWMRLALLHRIANPPATWGADVWVADEGRTRACSWQLP